MTWPFRLNGQAVKHARLTNSQIADVDHLLHFAFAFGDDFPGLERHELAELVFQFTQRVAKATNSLAADRSRRCAPF
jgi:hypothetical protein